MTARKRRLMSLSLERLAAFPRVGPSPRPLLATDRDALAALMFAAYRGTIDDEGGSEHDAGLEVDRTFAGSYGRMLWEASFVASDPHDDQVIASASVVTWYREAPLLSFAMTRPSLQRRGFSRSLIIMSAHALLLHGHSRLTLVVTQGNTRAERLYESLGFEELEVR